MFYVFVLSIFPVHEGWYSPRGSHNVSCLLQPFSAAGNMCLVGTGGPIKGRSAVYGVSGELDGPPVPSKESQDPDMDLPQVL